MTACLSHCREAPALLLQLCSDAKEDTQLCKIRQRVCPMSVWGRGSGCQVAGSQRGTARRGLCSSAAPAADPVPPNRIYFTIFHPRTSFCFCKNNKRSIHPYRVPHGSQCVMSRLIHTGLGSSSLIAHVLHSPPPPREQLCNRSCSNKTHTGYPPYFNKIQ